MASKKDLQSSENTGPLSNAPEGDSKNVRGRVLQKSLTPAWDAWLGLRPAGAYSGIDSDGVRR